MHNGAGEGQRIRKAFQVLALVCGGIVGSVSAQPVGMAHPCPDCLAETVYQPLPGGLICFRGDGNPLSDLCISTWEATTVVECASAGNPYVPFDVNTGTQNPGAGYVRLFQDVPGGQELIVEAAFSSRGFAWPSTTNIVVEPEEVGFRDGGEGCACHTRAADPVAACGGR